MKIDIIGMNSGYMIFRIPETVTNLDPANLGTKLQDAIRWYQEQKDRKQTFSFELGEG